MDWKESANWLQLLGSLGILAGLVLVAIQLNQNTEHLRLQLVDQINSRLYQNNRDVMGENPAAAIEKSVVDPASMTFAEFKIVDAYLINAVNDWEDRYFLYQAGLVDADYWKQRIDEDASWFFGNPFAKKWWRGAGSSVVQTEVAEYVDQAIRSVHDDDTYSFFERSRVEEPGLPK